MPHILMIKKVLGYNLKYLCKTSSSQTLKDELYPYKYKGSGKRWLNHIKAHKGLLITCVIGTYETAEELKDAGIYYSRLFDVVNSDEWANLTEEKGDGGLVGFGQLGKSWKMSESARENVRIAQLIRQNEETPEMKKERYDKNRGKNNYQFKGVIRTPWGDFDSLISACSEAKKIRKSGRKDVISDVDCLRNRIDNLDVPFNTSRVAFDGWRNKTPRNVGFDFLKMESDDAS